MFGYYTCTVIKDCLKLCRLEEEKIGFNALVILIYINLCFYNILIKFSQPCIDLLSVINHFPFKIINEVNTLFLFLKIFRSVNI